MLNEYLHSLYDIVEERYGETTLGDDTLRKIVLLGSMLDDLEEMEEK